MLDTAAKEEILGGGPWSLCLSPSASHEGFWTQQHKEHAEDAYVCKAARTIEQAAELIEAGFEYVCEMEGFKLFRKRK